MSDNSHYLKTRAETVSTLTWEQNIGKTYVAPGGLPDVGYVPPTRVDFSLPKIQSRPRFLTFYSRTGPDF